MQLAENLVMGLQQHKFASLLFPKNPIIVRIITDEIIYITISTEEVTYLVNYDGKVHFTISGPRNMIEPVIMGKIKLQEAVKAKDIEINGSFRMLLLLESIFWLH